MLTPCLPVKEYLMSTLEPVEDGTAADAAALLRSALQLDEDRDDLSFLVEWSMERRPMSLTD